MKHVVRSLSANPTLPERLPAFRAPEALSLVVALALGSPGVLAADGAAPSAAPSAATATTSAFKSIEFSNTPAASNDDEALKTWTKSIATITYADGTKREFPLQYHSLFRNVDSFDGQAAGQLYDHAMKPVKDLNGDPVIAETPDSNSLMKVGDKLMMVTHWEYDDILADGRQAFKVPDWYSRMAMSMSLSELSQAKDGTLKVTKQKPVDFSSVDGGWIFCAGSLTPWNTHLGGEEDYDLYFVPGEKSYKTTQAGLKALNEVYFRKEKKANPYHYGYPIEVAPKADGSYSVAKHYEMGRGTWELARFTNDGRTAFYGDDGAYSGLFMFVGDKQNDPKAGGTIYAAKWNQTSPDGSDGGTADIEWFRLGHGTHAEIKAIIDKGTTIDDIFEHSLTEKEGFVPTRAGSAETVWLKLKPGMEQAAAFLEPRRYAALLGATTEFTKGEGVVINHADHKMYYAMSYIQTSMKAQDGGPVDHIRLKENKSGATYTFDLKGGVKDSKGGEIASGYVPVKAYVEPALLGKPMKTDADGNTAEIDSIANTDNLYFSEKMRTLFIGEDSGNHVNNYLWAYNVDTKKLSRLLVIAAGAESTGLQVVENMDGHAYIMANNQHQGDWLASQPKESVARLEKKAEELWGRNGRGTLNYRLEAHVGYLGGLPGVR